MLRKKVLVLCHDTVGAKMAGPGIRYQNIAEQIGKVADVTLKVYSDKDDSSDSRQDYLSTDGESYKSTFDQYDIIFAQWLSGDMLKYAKSKDKIVIIDLYAPVPIEYLASLGFSSKKIDHQNDLEFSGILETYKQYLTLADFFVCSNERQRDFWIGFMTASNILMPTNFNKYSRMNNIVLCPMGIPSASPGKTILKLRDRAGLAKDDFVMLWTGGIWDWFDAKVVIEAVNKLNNPRLKLVFMGTVHPNSKVAEMSESKRARLLAGKLGMTGKSVIFLDGWVDYEDRASYLKDADVAIYSDKQSFETRFSHRTRVLDHIWAGLPTICSQGDYLAAIISEKSLGIVAGDRTSVSFASAIKRAFENPSLLAQFQSNIQKEKQKFTWDEQTKDLLSYIKQAEIKNIDKLTDKTSGPVPKQPSYGSKVKRRLKNSIKVLLGRIDV